MSGVAVLPELTDQGLAQGMVRGDEVLNLDNEVASTREVVNDALAGLLQDSPVIDLDRFIEMSYAKRRLRSQGRGRT